MKKIITIFIMLAIFFISNGIVQAVVINGIERGEEYGERWKLMWELGERIKFEKRKTNPNQKLIDDMKSFYSELYIVKTADFDNSPRKDLIRSKLPVESYFEASSSPNLGAITQAPIVKKTIPQMIAELQFKLINLLKQLISKLKK